MNRRLSNFAWLLVGVGAIGCGSGATTHPYKDATPDDASDGGTAGTGSAGGTGMAGADAGPPPMGATGTKLLLGGESIQLIGSSADSCTNQIPYWTDRWCGFARPGTLGNNTELWVINVSKVAAGVAVTCNTAQTDPNCLRLSIGLLQDETFGLRTHRFDGDSLIYSEGGNIFAWRPGWAMSRKISSQTGQLCIASKTSASALCIENVDVDAKQTRGKIDLHAGRIDSPAGGTLAFVDTFMFFTNDDGDNDFSRYGWELSPDGQSVAWSGRYEIGGKEILKVQKIGDDASRATVAEDVSQWSISGDGSKWYWLSAFNYDGLGKASGTLQSAPFPAGTAPRMLAAKVGQFFPAGPKGLAMLTGLAPNAAKQGVGALFLMPDTDAPATLKMLDTAVLSVFDVTSDGKQFMYAKNEEVLGGSFAVYDLLAARDDGTTPCTLSSAVAAFADPSAPSFLSGGSVAVFGRISQAGDGEGFYVNVAACTAKKFASEIYEWHPVGDEGFIFSDDLAFGDNGSAETTLRYAVAADGALPAAGTKVVQTRAGLQFAPLLPAMPGVVYTVNALTAQDGLYLNNALPFKATPPIAAPDGGVPPSDGGGPDAPGGEVAAETGAPEAGAPEAGAPETGTPEAGAGDGGVEPDVVPDAPSDTPSAPVDASGIE